MNRTPPNYVACHSARIVPSSGTPAGRLSRRRFLAGAMAGGVTLFGANASRSADDRSQDVFARAARSAKIAGYSISKVQRWLHEKALPLIDPETGLYRADGHWNYRDTAADCYPFLCWAAHLVDRKAL
ncbi:MAG: hypothetical protein GXP27_07970, partial [Planctomycetes bacterium]|nr:hypothetical protein [Planctomycetota bacterium]